MGSEKRRWIWIATVALAAAALWWLYPEEPPPSQAPSIPEPPALQASPEPSRSKMAAPSESDAPSDVGEPFAAPLPRDEVQLPEKRSAPDAGIESDDPATVEEKRDQMLSVVLDRLSEDLRAAEEAGDEERAAQLKVRIERLEKRRDELRE